MNRILFIVPIIPIIKIDEIVFNKLLIHRLCMSNLISFLSLYISFFSVSFVRKEVLKLYKILRDTSPLLYLEGI